MYCQIFLPSCCKTVCRRVVLKEKITLGNFKSCPNRPEKKERTYEHVLNYNAKVFGVAVEAPEVGENTELRSVTFAQRGDCIQTPLNVFPSSDALPMYYAKRSWNLASMTYCDIVPQLCQKVVLYPPARPHFPNFLK